MNYLKCVERYLWRLKTGRKMPNSICKIQVERKLIQTNDKKCELEWCAGVLETKTNLEKHRANMYNVIYSKSGI